MFGKKKKLEELKEEVESGSVGSPFFDISQVVANPPSSDIADATAYAMREQVSAARQLAAQGALSQQQMLGIGQSLGGSMGQRQRIGMGDVPWGLGRPEIRDDVPEKVNTKAKFNAALAGAITADKVLNPQRHDIAANVDVRKYKIDKGGVPVEVIAVTLLGEHGPTQLLEFRSRIPMPNEGEVWEKAMGELPMIITKLTMIYG